MVLRAQLIDQLLTDCSGEALNANTRSVIHWTDMQRFEEDNILELDSKISTLDNEIWSKIVVMEKGTRTAKAYLRTPSLEIDGSTHEFDGYRLGVRRFRNPFREPSTDMALLQLAKGLVVSVDAMGNIFLANHTGKKVIVSSQGVKYTVDSQSQKIFDLRRFKEALSDSLPREHQRMKQKAIMFIQFNSNGPPLESPLWFCLVHVIAVEMTSLMMNNSLRCTSSAPSTSSSMSQPSARAPSPPEQLYHEPENDTEDHFYEVCAVSRPSNDDTSYSIPDMKASSSTSSTSPQRSRQDQRTGLFMKNERESSRKFKYSENSNRLKKKGQRDKSAGPVLISSRSQPDWSMIDSGGLKNLKPSSNSIIDLRTLANLRQPVYFKQSMSNRGGNGHLVAS